MESPKKKRATYQDVLDAPEHMEWATVDLPDPETPVGARGIGEPPVGAGACAVAAVDEPV